MNVVSKLLLLLFSGLLRFSFAAPGKQTPLGEIVALFRVELALQGEVTPSVRKEIAKACLKARSFKNAELVLDSCASRECARRTAEACDLIFKKVDDTEECNTVQISSKDSKDDSFSSRNLAVEMLLEDLIKNPQWESQEQEKNKQYFQTGNTRSLIISEFKSSSKKDEPLKTKATRLWELYTSRYRGTRVIRLRIYSLKSPHSPLREITVPVLTTCNDLRTAERCGSDAHTVYMRGTVNGAKMIPISTTDSTTTLIELGLHPSSNIYLP